MKIGLLAREQATVLLIIVLTIPALLALTRPGFFPTQDYIYVARVYQMDKSLFDGQFPVRWIPDFRYGEPLYNFYAPLPYYLGAVVKALGFSYLNTVKILFALGFVLSGVAMYFLAKQFFGSLGGVVSAVLYIFAPYHSVDVYVRGALSESWALIFFPLIFLFAYQLSKKAGIMNLIWLALSLAGLFYTHNIMTMLFMPFFVGWCGFLLWQNRSVKSLGYLVAALFLGAGLAASFLLPAYFEKDFVQSDKLIKGYFDFRGHFVAIPEFFSTFWGYGASLWGPKDDMSFQVGVAHWAFLAAVFACIFKKAREIKVMVIFLAVEFLFSLFMQHNRSAPIWEAFSLMAFTQFPWRFLGISIFLASLIGGAVMFYLPPRLKNLIFIPLLLGVIALYVGYFHPESYYLDSVDDHYISKEILAKDDRLPKDYLPIWVKKISDQKIETPVAGAGKAQISNFHNRSASATFNATVKYETEIETPITYFPGWEVKANSAIVKIDEPDELGLIRFKLPAGEYHVSMQLTDTPIRAWGNILSLISVAGIVLLFVGRKFNRL